MLTYFISYAPLWLNLECHYTVAIIGFCWLNCVVQVLANNRLIAMPTAWVAHMLAPLTFSTGLQLAGGIAPKPPFYPLTYILYTVSNPKVIDMGQEPIVYTSTQARGYILHDMHYVI